MLFSQNRLRKSEEIREVIKKGRQFRSSAFSLKVRGNNLKQFRAGFVISSKELKKAVQRNKIKRRAREILRKRSSDLKGGYDLLFIFTNKAKDLTFENLKVDLEDSLKRAGLL